jgi:hypothetical protein
MAKQLGHCAFTNACANVNSDHIRLEGTNKIVCKPHYKSLSLTRVGEGEGDGVSAANATPALARTRAPRRGWLAETLGLVGGGY